MVGTIPAALLVFIYLFIVCLSHFAHFEAFVIEVKINPVSIFFIVIPVVLSKFVLS